MNYGLYQSASGLMASSLRQDVIANNIANVETTGFKRDTSSFQQRLTEAQLNGRQMDSNPLLENLGGGLIPHPTAIDFTQGELETTGNSLDLAIYGHGYFAVKDGEKTRLTRDGRLGVDRDGSLILANGNGQQKVLDEKMQPIKVDPFYRGSISVGETGELTENGQTVAKIGLFDINADQKLKKEGGNLLSLADMTAIKPATGQIRSEFVERSNVDPAIELTQLMDAQRQLEANANMIRYQDQTLGRLVNDVGKMS